MLVDGLLKHLRPRCGLRVDLKKELSKDNLVKVGVVFNGDSLLWELWHRPPSGHGVAFWHGGVYKHFAVVVDNFFRAFLQLGIPVSVVFGPDCRGSDLSTITQHLSAGIQSDVYDSYLPVLGQTCFRQTLMALQKEFSGKVQVRVSLIESTAAVANEATSRGAYAVCSTSSSSLAMGADLLLASELTFYHGSIQAVLIRAEDARRELGLVTLQEMALLWTLTGCGLPQSALLPLHSKLQATAKEHTIVALSAYVQGGSLAATDLFPNATGDEQAALFRSFESSLRSFARGTRDGVPSEDEKATEQKLEGLESRYSLPHSLLRLADRSFKVPSALSSAAKYGCPEVFFAELRKCVYALLASRLGLSSISVAEATLLESKSVVVEAKAMPSSVSFLAGLKQVLQWTSPDDSFPTETGELFSTAALQLVARSGCLAGCLGTTLEDATPKAIQDRKVKAGRLLECLVVSLVLKNSLSFEQRSQFVLPAHKLKDQDQPILAVISAFELAMYHVLLYNAVLEKPLAEPDVTDCVDGRLMLAVWQLSDRKNFKELLRGSTQNAKATQLMTCIGDPLVDIEPSLLVGIMKFRNQPVSVGSDTAMSFSRASLAQLWPEQAPDISSKEAKKKQLTMSIDLWKQQLSPNETSEGPIELTVIVDPSELPQTTLLPRTVVTSSLQRVTTQAKHELDVLQRSAEVLRGSRKPLVCSRNVFQPKNDKGETIVVSKTPFEMLSDFVRGQTKLEPYPFQQEAFQAIFDKKHVLCTAPTGAGKTEVAMFAVCANLCQSFTSRVLYVCPSVAPVSQVACEILARFDTEKTEESLPLLGIQTSELVINPDAQIVITVPQILRQQLVSVDVQEQFKNVSCVVLDEIHASYSCSDSRFWEELILLLPKHVRFVVLSGTGEVTKFSKWFENAVKDSAALVHSSTSVSAPQLFASYGRNLTPIPAEAFAKPSVASAEAIIKVLSVEPTTNSMAPAATTTAPAPKKKGKAKVVATPAAPTPGTTTATAHASPSSITPAGALECQLAFQASMKANFEDSKLESATLQKLVAQLNEDKRLPSIFVSFERQVLETCAFELGTVEGLVDEKEKAEIEASISRIQALDASINKRLLSSLRAGVGIQHQELNTGVKLEIERLFRNGVLKILVATPDFALGVHLPCASVVFCGDEPATLDATTFRQVCGRAGRLGQDANGLVVFAGKFDVDRVRLLLSSEPTPVALNLELSTELIMDLLTQAFLLQSTEQAEQFVSRSMLAYDNPRSLERQLRWILQFLFVSGLIDSQAQPTLASTLLKQTSSLGARGMVLLDIFGTIGDYLRIVMDASAAPADHSTLRPQEKELLNILTVFAAPRYCTENDGDIFNRALTKEKVLPVDARARVDSFNSRILSLLVTTTQANYQLARKRDAVKEEKKEKVVKQKKAKAAVETEKESKQEKEAKQAQKGVCSERIVKNQIRLSSDDDISIVEGLSGHGLGFINYAMLSQFDEELNRQQGWTLSRAPVACWGLGRIKAHVIEVLEGAPIADTLRRWGVSSDELQDDLQNVLRAARACREANDDFLGSMAVVLIDQVEGLLSSAGQEKEASLTELMDLFEGKDEGKGIQVFWTPLGSSIEQAIVVVADCVLIDILQSPFIDVKHGGQMLQAVHMFEQVMVQLAGGGRTIQIVFYRILEKMWQSYPFGGLVRQVLLQSLSQQKRFDVVEYDDWWTSALDMSRVMPAFIVVNNGVTPAEISTDKQTDASQEAKVLLRHMILSFLLDRSSAHVTQFTDIALDNKAGMVFRLPVDLGMTMNAARSLLARTRPTPLLSQANPQISEGLRNTMEALATKQLDRPRVLLAVYACRALLEQARTEMNVELAKLFVLHVLLIEYYLTLSDRGQAVSQAPVRAISDFIASLSAIALPALCYLKSSSQFDLSLADFIDARLLYKLVALLSAGSLDGVLTSQLNIVCELLSLPKLSAASPFAPLVGREAQAVITPLAAEAPAGTKLKTLRLDPSSALLILPDQAKPTEEKKQAQTQGWEADANQQAALEESKDLALLQDKIDKERARIVGSHERLLKEDVAINAAEFKGISDDDKTRLAALLEATAKSMISGKIRALVDMILPKEEKVPLEKVEDEKTKKKKDKDTKKGAKEVEAKREADEEEAKKKKDKDAKKGKDKDTKKSKKDDDKDDKKAKKEVVKDPIVLLESARKEKSFLARAKFLVDNVTAADVELPKEVAADQPKDGWTCNKCGTVNWRQRAVCTCGENKPAGESGKKSKKDVPIETNPWIFLLQTLFVWSSVDTRGHFVSAEKLLQSIKTRHAKETRAVSSLSGAVEPTLNYIRDLRDFMVIVQQGRKDLEPGAYFRKLEEKLDDFLHPDKKALYKIKTGDPILIPLVMELVKTGQQDWELGRTMSAALSLYRVVNAAFRIYIQHLALDQVQALQQALYSLGCSETEDATRGMCQEWCDETKLAELSAVWQPPPAGSVSGIGKSYTAFQLEDAGHLLVRNVNSVRDSRVPFFPDGWQKDLLDHVDNRKSVLVTAPTSSGKTFISYYCMKAVVKWNKQPENANRKQSAIYVAPTIPLINQAYADLYSKYKNASLHRWTPGTLNLDNPDKIDILVCLPGSLEKLLLAPEWGKFVQRLSRGYVILDEVHCMGDDDGYDRQDVWERMLVMLPCPFIALSATLANKKPLLHWLRLIHGRDQVKAVEFKDRWSHLHTFVFNPPRSRGNEVINSTLQAIHPLSILAEISDPARVMELAKRTSLAPKDAVKLCSELEKLSAIPEVAAELKRLKPFFANKGAIRLDDVKLWTHQLINLLCTKLPSDKFQSVITSLWSQCGQAGRNTIPPNFLDVYFLDLLRNLQKNDFLPGIVFGASHAICESLLTTVVESLERNEMAEREIAYLSSESKRLSRDIEFTPENKAALKVQLLRVNENIDRAKHLLKFAWTESTDQFFERLSSERKGIFSKLIERLKAKVEELSRIVDRAAQQEAAAGDKRSGRGEDDADAGGGREEQKGTRDAQIEALSQAREELEKAMRIMNPGIDRRHSFGSFPREDNMIFLDRLARKEPGKWADPATGLNGKSLLWEKNIYLRALSRGIGLHLPSLGGPFNDLVELGFRKGYLNVVITDYKSLSYGINMPCRTAVFAGDSVGLTTLKYQQCAGRAGRRGYDYYGNTVLYGVPARKYSMLMTADLPAMMPSFYLNPTLPLRSSRVSYAGEDDVHVRRLFTMPNFDVSRDYHTPERIIAREAHVKAYMQWCMHFSLECGYLLNQNNPVTGRGPTPTAIGRIAAHLFEFRPGNFLFCELLRRGVLHSVVQSALPAEKQVVGKRTEDTKLNEKDMHDCAGALLEVLAHLFEPIRMRRGLPTVRSYGTGEGKVYKQLRPLSLISTEAAAIVRFCNNHAMLSFKRSLSKRVQPGAEVPAPRVAAAPVASVSPAETTAPVSSSVSVQAGGSKEIKQDIPVVTVHVEPTPEAKQPVAEPAPQKAPAPTKSSGPPRKTQEELQKMMLEAQKKKVGGPGKKAKPTKALPNVPAAAIPQTTPTPTATSAVPTPSASTTPLGSPATTPSTKALSPASNPPSLSLPAIPTSAVEEKSTATLNDDQDDFVLDPYAPRLPPDCRFPFSDDPLPKRNETPSELVAQLKQEAPKLQLRSKLYALSNPSDDFSSSIEMKMTACCPLPEELPTLETTNKFGEPFALNAYVLTFFHNPDGSALTKDNDIPEKDVWGVTRRWELLTEELSKVLNQAIIDPENDLLCQAVTVLANGMSKRSVPGTWGKSTQRFKRFKIGTTVQFRHPLYADKDRVFSGKVVTVSEAPDGGLLYRIAFKSEYEKHADGSLKDAVIDNVSGRQVFLVSRFLLGKKQL